MKKIIKTAENIIAVGGPVAVGKSTLVASLKGNKVEEIDDKDPYIKELLKGAYENKEKHNVIFQTHVLTSKRKHYENAIKSSELTIFDRTIFEDYMFAQKRLKKGNFSDFYNEVYEYEIDLLKNTFGVPKIYFLLTCSWDTFVERINKRGRTSEISAIKIDDTIFRDLFNMYSDFADKLKKEGINVKIIKTDGKSPFEILQKVEKILIEQGVNYE